MTDFDRYKAHCSACGPGRWADVVGKHTTSWSEHGVYGSSQYMILRCRGCEEVFFVEEESFSEAGYHEYKEELGQEQWIDCPTISRWPSPSSRPIPSWNHEISDTKLSDILREFYGALNSESNILAAIGARTAFDVICLRLSISGVTFRDKLQGLKAAAMLSIAEFDGLEVLVDAGNAAAHQGWKPTAEEIGTLATILESLIERIIILPERAARLKAVVPPRLRTSGAQAPAPGFAATIGAALDTLPEKAAPREIGPEDEARGGREVADE